jgi:hypothetical protein
VKLVAGVVTPLLVLAGALALADPALLAGAALALGTVFGVVYAYARYVDFDAGPARGGVGADERERESPRSRTR